MPKLDEIRNWLRDGQKAKELPDHWKNKERQQEELEQELEGMQPSRTKLNTDKAKRAYNRKLYDVSTDGKDAILKFGKFKGWKVSALAKTSDGYGYLQWVMRNDFPSELKDILSGQGVPDNRPGRIEEDDDVPF